MLCGDCVCRFIVGAGRWMHVVVGQGDCMFFHVLYGGLFVGFGSSFYTVHLSTLQTRKYAWKDVGMVATRYCKGIAVLIVACFVGFWGSVDLVWCIPT